MSNSKLFKPSKCMSKQCITLCIHQDVCRISMILHLDFGLLCPGSLQMKMVHLHSSATVQRLLHQSTVKVSTHKEFDAGLGVLPIVSNLSQSGFQMQPETNGCELMQKDIQIIPLGLHGYIYKIYLSIYLSRKYIHWAAKFNGRQVFKALTVQMRRSS